MHGKWAEGNTLGAGVLSRFAPWPPMCLLCFTLSFHHHSWKPLESGAKANLSGVISTVGHRDEDILPNTHPQLIQYCGLEYSPHFHLVL